MAIHFRQLAFVLRIETNNQPYTYHVIILAEGW